MSPTVVVVGGGITGLAAAWQLTRAPDPPRVVVLEGADRLGGKIATTEVAGVVVEAGPDAFLARVPHAVDLCAELGLAADLVPPAAGHAFLWTRGRLRRLPAGLVLGVPSDLVAVARSRIVGPAGLVRAGLDLVLPATPEGAERSVGGISTSDRSVGEIVAARFGRQVQERLVDPLVGGIHAGRSELLSARATAPQLDAAARSGRSLLLALRRQTPPAGSGPVFLTHPEGLRRLIGELETRLRAAGADIRTGTPVTGLRREAGTWRIRTAGGGAGIGTAGGATETADAVILTTPAPAAAALLGEVCPAAAALLGGIEQASVVVATFAYPLRAVERPLEGTGFLVPRPDGRLMTAATFLSTKWAHLARPDVVLVRVSAGRFRDDRVMRLDDGEVVGALHDELADAVGLRERPADATVTRWRDSFPQYAVGHLDRVARVEEAVGAVPGLAVAGAALRGVGIPACTAQGRQAADRVLAGLAAGAAA